MNIVIVLGIIIAVLFAVTYFTRRRFGVLGLALCAGYLLSTMWTGDVTPWIEGAGVELVAPPLSSLVAVGLVLLPAVLLLFSGPTYHKKLPRLLGAVLFALLAAAFMLGPLGNSLSLDAMGTKVYQQLVDNKNVIITVAIAYALYDLLILKTPKPKDKK
ncbi:MAG TPA: hypothetical protein VMT96_00860 [Candidatus Bathyarchaeia archaeon]|nr:hypothetical protein [Candidatus Bathyarchaeia archaeon]